MPELILIVEDESKIAELVMDYLVASGYQCHHLMNGDDVMPWLETNQPALVILDVMLPGKSGFELCKAINDKGNVPVILLTARVEESDRLQGLELGADDYICKPFSPKEVVARVKNVLRRFHGTTLANDILALNKGTMKAVFKGSELSLTAVEFAVLSLMAAEPGKIFTRETLMEHMYKDNRVVSDRTIDSHIKKLRKKIAEVDAEFELIHSVYGVGYKVEGIPPVTMS